MGGLQIGGLFEVQQNDVARKNPLIPFVSWATGPK